MVSLCLILPSAILLITWLYTWTKNKENFPLYILLGIWTFIIGSFWLLNISQPYFEPMKVSEEDNYGTYSVLLDKFDKTQAKWQHDNYEFNLSRDNFLRLYKLLPNRHLIDSVRFEFVEYAANKRIRLYTDSTHNHIIVDSPTLFRKSFNKFFYVFNSPRYGNMFFEKN